MRYSRAPEVFLEWFLKPYTRDSTPWIEIRLIFFNDPSLETLMFYRLCFARGARRSAAQPIRRGCCFVPPIVIADYPARIIRRSALIFRLASGSPLLTEQRAKLSHAFDVL